MVKVLYIDIYFLVNFTIDLVSLYFAALFSKIRCTNKRLLISAIIGAAISCVVILIDYPIIQVVLSLLALVSMDLICSGKRITKRSFVFCISFIIFLSLIGGFVSYFWNLLSEIFEGYVISNDKINRRILFLAIIVLLSIGVFKMFITVMNTSNIDSKVSFIIQLQDKICETEALVDTGNLAIDPMSMRPVLIIKRELAEKFLPMDIIELSNIDDISRGMKKRIRLIPISRGSETHVLVGIRPDSVRIKTSDGYEDIDVTIAIDKEGGDFGGYIALMPASALKNVHM